MRTTLDPVAWKLFQQFTFELIRRGVEHYSADAVLHRVRWETSVSTLDDSGYKCNNDLTPLFARKFHDAHPEHAGFFRTRVSKFDGVL